MQSFSPACPCVSYGQSLLTSAPLDQPLQRILFQIEALGLFVVRKAGYDLH